MAEKESEITKLSEIDTTIREEDSVGWRFIKRSIKTAVETEGVADPKARERIYHQAVDDIIRDISPLVPDGEDLFEAVLNSLYKEVYGKEWKKKNTPKSD